MKYYAVIDTNVLVSFLLTKNRESSVVKVINLIEKGVIIPIIHSEIVDEYKEVLGRVELKIAKPLASNLIDTITDTGIYCDRKEANEIFPDPDDIVFYEVSLSVENSYLITGNLKHFPKNGHVVTPAEMLQIIHLSENSTDSICEPTFEYMSEKRKKTMDKVSEAFDRIRKYVSESDAPELTMDEINEEIRKYREERRQKRGK